MPELRVELCAKCHPFYTGTQKLLDTSRRVEKFVEKSKAKDAITAVTGKKAKSAKRAAQKEAKKAAKQTVEA